MTFALAVPSVGAVLFGFALTGLGVATLVPALPHGVGRTVVGFVPRGGFLFSPTLIGVVADPVSLRAALFSVAVAGLVVLVLGRVLTMTAASTAPDDDLVLPGSPAAGLGTPSPCAVT